MAPQKIMYFTAASVLTPEEKAEIASLMPLTAPPYSVVVRDATASPNFGYGPEATDYVMGTTIPAAYEDVPVFDPDDLPGELPELPEGYEYYAVASQVAVYSEDEIFVSGDVTTQTVGDITAVSKVQLPGTVALAVHNATSYTGIDVTGTAGTGKTVTFTVVDNVITAIALS
jgi:hypothetical protein